MQKKLGMIIIFVGLLFGIGSTVFHFIKKWLVNYDSFSIAFGGYFVYVIGWILTLAFIILMIFIFIAGCMYQLHNPGPEEGERSDVPDDCEKIAA